MGGFEVNALPDVILQNVLCFISGKDLLVYRRVCKRWRDIIDSRSLWKDKCVRENLNYVHHLPEPKDFRMIYFKRPYNRNLIQNPCAKEQFKYWKLKAEEGRGFLCEVARVGCYPILYFAPISEYVPNWATSFGLCEKSQLLDLVEMGCSENILDNIRPAIHISEWYCARFDSISGGQYCLRVQLLSEDASKIDEFHFEQVIPDRGIWHEVSHRFVDYPAGVRFVSYSHSGVDTTCWGRHYGPKFTLSTVKLIFPSPR